MVPPSGTSASAWRREPGPLSAVEVTIIVDPSLGRYLDPAIAAQRRAKRYNAPARWKRRSKRRILGLRLIYYRITNKVPSIKFQRDSEWRKKKKRSASAAIVR